MFVLDQSPGRTAIINGEEHLFFSGYSYLGMSHVPAFIDLVNEGINRYGVLHPSSRISNTQLDVFVKMEDMLSSITGQEETIVYSSGFLAGRAVVDWVGWQPNAIFIAPGVHPALQTPQATVLQYNWQADASALFEEGADEVVLLLDSIDPLTATITDFAFLERIPSGKKITCVIDDSHGIGLLGQKGEGISSMLPKLANVRYVITYSLSKAFHINGGAITCSKEIAASLRRSSFYTASTSIAPSLAYAFVNSQEIYNEQRIRLLHNMKFLQKEIGNIEDISSHEQLPILILTRSLDQDYFTRHRIIISSFSYPDPSGDKINRIVLNALHSEADLIKLSTAIRKA